jgi:hypothetical protein
MGFKKRVIDTILIAFIVIQLPATMAYGAENDAPSPLVGVKNGEFLLQAEGAPLGQILEEMDKRCSVKIIGLAGREKEQITFSLSGKTVEEGIKLFLRHLGEKNYVFEFVDENLRFVSVFPEAKEGRALVSPRAKEDNAIVALVNVVGVKGIIEGSQAEGVGLIEGDLIITYDGVKIGSTRQLIREVEERSDRDQVEMVVVRDNVLMRFTLDGGFIGVRIVAKKIPKTELDYYYSGN